MSNSTLHTDSFNHVIGQSFSDKVKKAINNKQKLMARKNRAHNQYFHNNSAWIKLASSVRVVGGNGKNKLIDAGLPSYMMGNTLAINFYLFSEMKAGSARETYLGEDDSDLETSFSGLRKNRGLKGRGAGSYNSSYGFGGLQFGFRPLPGIMDLKIETLGNNGSLKKATITLKAFNKQQFNIIELLYLRLGYHVLIEYGNRLYITNSLGIKNTGSTLLESSWFGDENFVDVNDPDLEEMNDDIVQQQDELVILEQEQEADTEALETAEYNQEQNQLALDEMTTREKKQYRFAVQEGYTEEKYGSKGDALLAFADHRQDHLDNDWHAFDPLGYQQESVYLIRKIGRRYNAIEDAIETAKTIEERQEERQKEIDESNQRIQELREDINEKLDDFLDKLNIEIDQFRKEYNHDYDGMIGRVTNFDWTLDTNGVYNIKVEVFSAGDVLQSLAVNNKNSPIGTYETTQQKDGSNPLNITKDAGDMITALNNLATLARGYKVEDEEEFAKSQISKKDLALINGETADTSGDINEDADVTNIEATEAELASAEYLEAEKANRDVSYMRGFAGLGKDVSQSSPLIYLNRIDTIVKLLKGVNGAYIDGFDELGSQTTTTYYDNSGFNIVKVKANGTGAASNAFYIRFGFYLQLLQAITFPKFAGSGRLGKPMLRILTESKKYPFFKNDLLASSRPSICAVRTAMRVTAYLDAADDKLKLPQGIIDNPVQEIMQAGEGKEMFANINYQVDGVTYGDIMNIYLNMDYIAQQLLQEETDEYGESNFLQHIGKICKDVNDSLGNITNIDFKVDEDRNIVYFIDKKLQPGLDGLLDKAAKPKNPYVFNINGFVNISGAGLMGNIVRDFNLKSSIPPNLSTMITVGSNQASSGHTGRTDATAFTTWNKGLQDKVLPVKFIEGFDAQYRNGEPTLTTINKRNNAYIKYFKQISKLYTAEIDKPGGGTVTVSTGFFWWQEETTTTVDTKKQYVAGVDLTVESGIMELQRKAITIPQIDSSIKTGVPSPTAGFLPIDLQLTFNGTSGIKIFETYTVPTKFLPRSYPDGLTFICKKLTHTINDKGWLTKIQSFSLPTTQDADTAKTYYNRVSDLSPSYTPISPSGGSSGGGGGSRSTRTGGTSGGDYAQKPLTFPEVDNFIATSNYTNTRVDYLVPEIATHNNLPRRDVNKVDTIIVHHTGGWPTEDHLDLERTGKKRGLVSFPYHFVIRPDGSIMQGCDEDTRANHAGNINTKSFGVTYLGCYDTGGTCKSAGITAAYGQLPTQAAFDAFYYIMEYLQNKYPNIQYILCHRETAGRGYQCPGNALEPYIYAYREGRVKII